MNNLELLNLIHHKEVKALEHFEKKEKKEFYVLYREIFELRQSLMNRLFNDR